jgi:hypothetical protein
MLQRPQCRGSFYWHKWRCRAYNETKAFPNGDYKVKDATWTVVREYKNQCTVEEPVSRVIRRHLEEESR